MHVLTLLSLSLAPLASAHFGLLYPEWRADTLADNSPYNQWVYPCAGVLSNATGVNRTAWPLDGGSIKLDLHHAWTYIFISLGLQLTSGSTVTTFNYSLTGGTFWNSTGKGTLCVPKLTLPAGLTVRDGQNASIQVVTPGANGAGLYNCADIVFRANATVLPTSECQTPANLTYYQVQSGASTASNGTGNTTTKAPGSGAGSNGVNSAVLASVVGLAAFFVYGIGL